MKNDLALYVDVVDELRSDPALPAIANIFVRSNGGIITLTGTVASYWQKWEADDAAKRVTGVRGVVNDISIDFLDEMGCADSEMQRVASNMLAWHSDLPNTIVVSVTAGWITLGGRVHWQFQRNEAERTIESVSGVTGITNDITIESTPKVDDVQDRIRASFNRTVDAEPNRIEIDRSEGGVTLRGQVHSWVELDAANRAAWSVPGVAFVQNDLVVV